MKKIFDLPFLVFKIAVICVCVIFLTANLTIKSEAQTSYPSFDKKSLSVQILNTFNDELEEEFLIVQEKDFKVEY